MGSYPVAVVTRYVTAHKIAHHARTKQSTQNYTAVNKSTQQEGSHLHTMDTITIKLYTYNTNTTLNTVPI
jgi:hypothetical protein